MPEVIAVSTTCNAYSCRFIAKIGNLCTAKTRDIRGTVCMTFQREPKGDRVDNPRCHRREGKWVSDHHGVLK